MKPTQSPIANDFLKQPSKTNDHLVLFLPGMRDDKSAFESAGFFKEGPNGSGRFDIVAVDAHFGYYRNKQLTTRVFHDILSSNREKYRKISVLGVSLGGYGALWLADDYPAYIDQVILLAPFLGDVEMVNRVIEMDGMRQWYLTSQLNNQSVDDPKIFGDETWVWLNRLIYESNKPLIIGFGEQDRFARTGHLVAQELPKRHVYIDQGGHDWKTWYKLWQTLREDQLP